MNRTTVETRVAKILVEMLGVAEGDVRPEVRLMPANAGPGEPRHVAGEDLDADSLDVVELVMSFEEEFSIRIEDDEAEKLNDGTVKDAVDLIEAKLAQA